MSALWTAATMAQATGGTAQGEWCGWRVEIDSRRIQPGDVFVALKGERFDGHAYVKEAMARGAVAAVVEYAIEAVANQLIVPDTLKALEKLAVFNRARSTAKVVGVTGSVGKTSTKEMLRLALSTHGKTYATNGNYNNHIGTPLNVANMPLDTQFAVFEMGMNHAGEISHLTRLVRPHVAIISNVEAVHLAFFDSVEGIALAKAEIFEGMEENGAAVLNADQPYYGWLAERARGFGARAVFGCGKGENSECRLLSYQATPAGCALAARIMGKDYYYTLAATGQHWGIVSVMTLAVMQALGVSVAKTAAALEHFTEVEGRGRVQPIAVAGGNALLINDSYNASPSSMAAAFVKTHEVWETRGKKGRKVAVLGDMLELGTQAPQLHAQLAETLVAQGFDVVYTAGQLMSHLWQALPEQVRGEQAASAAELLPKLRLSAQDVVLIKGSHGSKMYQLAESLSAGEPTQHAV